jgi:hypothetical protein
MGKDDAKSKDEHFLSLTTILEATNIEIKNNKGLSKA